MDGFPRFGLGLSHNGGWSDEAVELALESGVSLFDTARRYGNESQLGEHLRRHIATRAKAEGLKVRQVREQVFVTTKLWPGDLGKHSTVMEDVIAAAESSAKALGVGSIDLYLVHWPGRWSPHAHPKLSPKQLRQEVWRGMEALLQRTVQHSSKLPGGAASTEAVPLVKRIGVSNFEVSHLQDVLEIATIPPVVNQVEFNPLQQCPDVMEFCKVKGIAVEGYCPFAKGDALSHPQVVAAAAKAKMDEASLLIQWSIVHRGVITIPMSMNAKHLTANIQAGQVAVQKLMEGAGDSDGVEEAYTALDGLHSNLRVTWDPSNVE